MIGEAKEGLYAKAHAKLLELKPVLVGRTFYSKDLWEMIGLQNKPEHAPYKKALADVMNNLSNINKEPIIAKDGKAFRFIELEVPQIKWWQPTEKKLLELKWPRGIEDGSSFGFEESIKVYPGDLIVLAGEGNKGKGHPIGTPILTLGGWKNIEHLQLKEDILGRDGQRHSVTGIFPRGKQPCYRFTFTDKSSVEVDSDHLWTIRKRWGRKTFNWLTKSTKEIIDLYGYFGKHNKNRIEIPVCEPLNFPREGIPLSPYLLGLLLGDGKLGSGTPTFSTADEELLSEFTRQGFGVSKRSKYDYGISGILDIVRNLAIDKGSRDKFIPSLYKFNAKEIRLAVLRGLMDTDGYISKQGWCEFTSISKQLADDVRFLVQSLGGRVSFNTKAFNKYTHKGESKLGQKSYRIGFMVDFNPFALPRKSKNWKAPSKPRNRAIKHIEPIGEFETICIQTDAEDGLYLTKDCIVTHNTTFALNFLIENMDNYACTYYSSEFNEIKFRDRIEKFNWVDIMRNGVPKFEVLPRQQYYEDLISKRRNNINIVDWIRMDEDPWKIRALLDRMMKPLDQGILVAVQQKRTYKNVGEGGEGSVDLASVYLILSNQKLRVEKVKAPNLYDPNYKHFGFELMSGTKFYNIREIKKCIKCNGNGSYRGTVCDECEGQGWKNK